MWTYKQCKTMLTHVFKPRWLVLILLSAGNREFRRGREKEKFGEEEREKGRTKRERGREERQERDRQTDRQTEKESTLPARGRKRESAEITESYRSPDHRRLVERSKGEIYEWWWWRMKSEGAGRSNGTRNAVAAAQRGGM